MKTGESDAVTEFYARLTTPEKKKSTVRAKDHDQKSRNREQAIGNSDGHQSFRVGKGPSSKYATGGRSTDMWGDQSNWGGKLDCPH